MKIAIVHDLDIESMIADATALPPGQKQLKEFLLKLYQLVVSDRFKEAVEFCLDAPIDRQRVVPRKLFGFLFLVCQGENVRRVA